MSPEQAEVYRLFWRAYDACTALEGAVLSLSAREIGVAWRMQQIMGCLTQMHPLLAPGAPAARPAPPPAEEGGGER